MFTAHPFKIKSSEGRASMRLMCSIQMQQGQGIQNIGITGPGLRPRDRTPGANRAASSKIKGGGTKAVGGAAPRRKGAAGTWPLHRRGCQYGWFVLHGTKARTRRRGYGGQGALWHMGKSCSQAATQRGIRWRRHRQAAGQQGRRCVVYEGQQ